MALLRKHRATVGLEESPPSSGAACNGRHLRVSERESERPLGLHVNAATAVDWTARPEPHVLRRSPEPNVRAGATKRACGRSG